MSDASGFAWDPVTRTYRDKDGKAIPAAVIVALRNAIADHAADGFAAATTAYLNGDLTLGEWATQFAGLIQGSATAGYLLGRGGQNAVTPISDDRRLHDVLQTQLAAARGFGVDLAGSGATLDDSSPALDDSGEIMTDENGDPVDGNGDPILDANGDPISLDAAQSLLGSALGLLARARSYDSAPLSGYSSGQGAAWGVDLPDTPPAHSRCRCDCSFDVDDNGQIIANWQTAGDERVCPICEGLEAQYSDYPTGVYAGGSANGGDGG